MQEDRSIEKRETISTGVGRRLGYLSMTEWAKHGWDLRRKLKAEKLMHMSARARIVQLKVKRLSLWKLARDASNSQCHKNLP